MNKSKNTADGPCTGDYISFQNMTCFLFLSIAILFSSSFVICYNLLNYGECDYGERGPAGANERGNA